MVQILGDGWMIKGRKIIKSWAIDEWADFNESGELTSTIKGCFAWEFADRKCNKRVHGWTIEVERQRKESFFKLLITQIAGWEAYMTGIATWKLSEISSMGVLMKIISPRLFRGVFVLAVKGWEWFGTILHWTFPRRERGFRKVSSLRLN